MIVELHAKTDVGRVRSGNEDNFLVLDLSQSQGWTGSDGAQMPEAMSRIEIRSNGVVLVVSDGMGGALAGDVASRMAVETVRDTLLGSEKAEPCNSSPDTELIECLCSATETANQLIHSRSQQDARYSGMGTTLTGAAITPEGIDFVQVGDSRGYVIRGHEIKLATKDQSLVQQLVDVGQINEQEAETHMFRNVILQALGAQRDLTPVVTRVRLRRGDIALLCSDGLSGKMRAEEMHETVTRAGGDLAAACAQLVELANSRGGEDNITVVLARFDGDGLAALDTDEIEIEQLDTDEDTTLDGDEHDTSPLP